VDYDESMRPSRVSLEKAWKSKKPHRSIDSNLNICAGNEKENDYFFVLTIARFDSKKQRENAGSTMSQC
jgi:hypothetical protein